MNNPQFYLKENVYFEPLFNHWYAWSYLISPATASRHVVNTHKRIMTSFVNNYKLHIMAAKESALTGGEFLNCSQEQVADIKGLIGEMGDKCADLIELCSAIKELEEMLRNHTSGECIDYLYAQVPEALKGYVEIFLDMEHRAGYRLIEPLLYDSRFYQEDLQSVSFGLIADDGTRPFVFSTPRLPDESNIRLGLNFNNELLDKLLAAREIPLSQADIDQIFNSTDTLGGLPVEALFTTERSEYVYEPVTEGLRLNYTGHAGFLVETKDLSILVDPVIASRGAQFAGDAFSFSELPPKLDYLCLTHNHQDHVCIETLLQLRYKTSKVIVPKNNGGSLADPSLRLLLKQLNFDVIEVDDMESVKVAGGKIVGVPFFGEHGDLNVRSKSGWFMELLGKKIYFAADSSNPDINLYKHIQKALGDVDMLCIGMECVGAPYTWLYGALHTKMVSKNIKNSRRLNGSDYQQALGIVDALNPKEVYIYALGIEPWYKYFMGVEYDDDSKQIVESGKLIETCTQRRIHCESLYGKKTLTFNEL